MTSVTVMTASHIQDLLNAVVATGAIDSSGFLTFTLADGITVGQVTTSVITNALVENAAINGSNHLILTLGDGVTTIDVGAISTPAVTNALVKSGSIDATTKHLVLTMGDNSTVDLGSINPDPVHVDPGLSATPASNFTVSLFTARTANGYASIHLECTYTGTTLTGDTHGDITNTLVATLPVGLRPAVSNFQAWDTSSTGGGVLIFLTDGTITIQTLSPGGTLASGGSVRCGFSYLIGP
jgi:hypothetical protein